MFFISSSCSSWDPPSLLASPLPLLHCFVPRCQPAPAPHAPGIHKAGLLPALRLWFSLCGIPHPTGSGAACQWMIRAAASVLGWTGADPNVLELATHASGKGVCWTHERAQQGGSPARAWPGAGLFTPCHPSHTYTEHHMGRARCQVLQGMRRHERDSLALLIPGVEPQG